MKRVHRDNAGENKTLEESCAKRFEENNFEFTSPDTPHQIGVIEMRFATLHFYTRAIMAHVVLQENLNIFVQPKCVVTTTTPENIMINQHDEKWAQEKF